MTLTKTQRKLVRTIQQLHQRGKPLNITAVKRLHPELIKAVYAVKPFWGWKRALGEAGIDYRKIKIELLDTVECALCGKSFRNLSAHIMGKHEVQPDEYLMDYPDTEFISETLRSERSLKKPSSLRHWEPIWSREYILDKMAETYRSGYCLNGWKVRAADQSLISAAMYYCGGWAKALRAIGLDPRQMFRHLRRSISRYPDKQSTLTEIRRRWNRHVSLHSSALIAHGGDYALHERGAEYFGGWFNALKAAKIDPDKVYKTDWRGPKYANAGDVTNAICRRVKHRWPLHYSGLAHGPHRDRLLYFCGQTYFGSWDQALRSAGVDPKEMKLRTWKRYVRRRFPDKSTLLNAIRQRYRAGVSMSTSLLQRGPVRDNHLYHCAIRWFGTWKEALDTAGLDGAAIAWAVSITRRKYQSAKDVIRAISIRVKRKRKVTRTALQRGPHSNFALLHSGIDYFTTWDQALAAAGVDLTVVSQRPRLKYRYPQKQSVVDAIQKRQAEGLPIHHYGVAHGNGHNAGLIKSAYIHFGSWDNALRAAGLDPQNIARSLYLRRRRYPDKESVLKAIAQRVRRGLPLNTLAVCKGAAHDMPLWNSASDYFGSWANALKAVGQDAGHGRG